MSVFLPSYPSDAAGGGGGGGGADLSALGFTPIDLTDGSWTGPDGSGNAYDLDDLVDSVAHSSGVNTITMNALGSGNSNHAWGNSSTQRGPRWVKALNVQDVNGSDVRIQSGDFFVFQTVMEFVSPDDRFAASSVVCVTPDGTSATGSDNLLVGGIIRYNTSGAQQHGSIAGDFSTVQSSVNNHRTTTVAHVRAQRTEAVTYITTNSSDAIIVSGRDTTTQNYGNATTNMNIMIGVGTFSTAGITAGKDVKLKAWFRCIKLSLPS